MTLSCIQAQTVPRAGCTWTHLGSSSFVVVCVDVGVVLGDNVAGNKHKPGPNKISCRVKSADGDSILQDALHF